MQLEGPGDISLSSSHFAAVAQSGLVGMKGETRCESGREQKKRRAEEQRDEEAKRRRSEEVKMGRSEEAKMEGNKGKMEGKMEGKGREQKGVWLMVGEGGERRWSCG